jgi:hypothetical protein
MEPIKPQAPGVPTAKSEDTTTPRQQGKKRGTTSPPRVPLFTKVTRTAVAVAAVVQGGRMPDPSSRDSSALSLYPHDAFQGPLSPALIGTPGEPGIADPDSNSQTRGESWTQHLGESSPGTGIETEADNSLHWHDGSQPDSPGLSWSPPGRPGVDSKSEAPASQAPKPRARAKKPGKGASSSYGKAIAALGKLGVRKFWLGEAHGDPSNQKLMTQTLKGLTQGKGKPSLQRVKLYLELKLTSFKMAREGSSSLMTPSEKDEYLRDEWNRGGEARRKIAQFMLQPRLPKGTPVDSKLLGTLGQRRLHLEIMSYEVGKRRDNSRFIHDPDVAVASVGLAHMLAAPVPGRADHYAWPWLATVQAPVYPPYRISKEMTRDDQGDLMDGCMRSMDARPTACVFQSEAWGADMDHLVSPESLLRYFGDRGVGVAEFPLPGTDATATVIFPGDKAYVERMDKIVQKCHGCVMLIKPESSDTAHTDL